MYPYLMIADWFCISSPSLGLPAIANGCTMVGAMVGLPSTGREMYLMTNHASTTEAAVGCDMER